MAKGGGSQLMSNDFGTIPYLVLGGYLMMLLGLGLMGLIRGKATEEDYYLAGRGQGLLVTALTIMATYFSGFAMLTFPGWVYQWGIAPMLLALNLPVAGAAIYLIGNKVRKLGTARGFVTPADMVSDYYGGSGLLRLLVVFVGMLYVIPYVIIQIKAGGHLAEALFGGVESIRFLGHEISVYDAGATALSVVTMVYVLVGGMRSVAWTDVIQGFLLLSAMILSGYAIIAVMGGPGTYFDQIAALPDDLLQVPVAPDRFNAWWMIGYCAFASLASIIHPGQWIRFYAARDSRTLRHTAVVFATVLPICTLFGVLLVGLGGRVLYPIDTGGNLPAILASADQIAVVVIREHFPILFGTIGIWLVALILVAVMAAAMSSADSNLHALSAVITRDVFDRVKPEANERTKAWVGRIVIVSATLIALGLSFWGDRNPDMGLLRTIGQFFLLAMAFSVQLLPITVDILFLRRGTSTGSACGLLAGLLVVFWFTPFPAILLGDGLTHWTATLRAVADVGMMGVAVNTAVFAGVSRFTDRVSQEKVREYKTLLTS
jgi:SSS family solute:Na+ symporter